MKDLALKIFSFFTPKRAAASAQPIPTPTPTPTMTPEQKYTKAIEKGFKEYSRGRFDVPAATLSGEFARAYINNPQLRSPYLLPSISINETGGGRNQSAEHNLLNWGIKSQRKGLFKPASPMEVIDKAATGISWRTPSTGYDNFRKTGDYKELVNTYAPPGENNSREYHRKILEYIEMFKRNE